jgi:hypothetical protein
MHLIGLQRSRRAIFTFQETLMSIPSVSFTSSRAYLPVSSPPADPAKATAQTSAAPTAAPAPPPDRALEADGDRDGDRRSAGPTNRLAQAMMAALHAIGLDAPAAPPEAASAGSTAPRTTPGGAAPPAQAGEAPAAAAGPAVLSAPAASPAAAATAETVASAVYQFAHELYAALRPAGRAESSRHGQEHEGGEVRRQESHGEHGWKSKGYGDIAQRLDALAQRLMQPAPAASAAGGSPPVSTSPPAVVAASATPTNPVPNAAANPLVEAFTKLFNALQPQGTAPTQTDMTTKLGVFLKALAGSLSPAAASGGTQALPVGGLIDVKA